MGKGPSFTSPTPSCSKSIRSSQNPGVPVWSKEGKGETCLPGRRRQNHNTPTRTDTILSPTPARGPAGRWVQGPAGPGRGPARADEARELRPRRRVGAPAAPSSGRRPPIPASVRARRSRLPGPRGESSCNFAGEAAAGLGLRASLRPAVRRQAAGAPTLRPARPAPGPALCAAARGARRPGPRPGHKRARGRRPAGPGLRGARAGPSWGPGPRPGVGLRSPAVEPVLAGVALDHEAGNVVGQPADAVNRHRRHVRAARPPAARAALRVGPGGPGRAGAGRAGAGDGPGAHDSPRAPAARPHKAGRAQAAGSRPPARGRRARVCAGPARGTQKGMDARGRRAGGEPRPHRRDPRPPSGLYVSAPGGAASARGLAAAPAAGRRAGDSGEGGPVTCWGEDGPGTCRGEGGPGDPSG